MQGPWTLVPFANIPEIPTWVTYIDTTGQICAFERKPCLKVRGMQIKAPMWLGKKKICCSVRIKLQPTHRNPGPSWPELGCGCSPTSGFTKAFLGSLLVCLHDDLDQQQAGPEVFFLFCKPGLRFSNGKGLPTSMRVRHCKTRSQTLALGHCC